MQRVTTVTAGSREQNCNSATQSDGCFYFQFAVSIVTGSILNDLDSFSRRTVMLFTTLSVPAETCTAGVMFLVMKATDHLSSSSSAGVKNVWSCVSVSTYVSEVLYHFTHFSKLNSLPDGVLDPA
jgi:hypothetical protein